MINYDLLFDNTTSDNKTIKDLEKKEDTKKSPWDCKPNVIEPLVKHKAITNTDDNIVLEKEVHINSNENFMEQLLYHSDHKLKVISNYVISNCDIIDKDHLNDITDNYYKIDNDNYYRLNDQQSAAIWDIIQSLEDKDILNLAQKKYSYFSSQKTAIENSFKTLQETNQIFFGLTSTVFSRIVLYVISNIFKYNLKNIANCSTITQFPLKSVIVNLGQAFISLFVHKYILYQLDKELKPEELKGFIQDKNALDIKVQFTLEDDLYSIIKHYLNNILINDYQDYNLGDHEMFNAALINLDKAYINLGTSIVNHLIKENILDTIIIKNNNVSQNFIIFKKKILQEDIFLQASYYKPPLNYNITLKEQHLNLNENVLLNIIMNDDIIRDTETVRIKKNPLLKSYIEEFSKVKYCINEQHYKSLLALLCQAETDLQPNKANDIPYKTQQIIEVFYETNITDLYKNKNIPKDILNDLCYFSLNFRTFYNAMLYDKVKDHITLLNFYNKIVSQKLIIKELLNDFNIYSKFKFFIIPKYITSTGRVFSKPYPLQLQASKLARTCIEFLSQGKLTCDLYQNYLEILKEEIPDINEIYTIQPYANYSENKQFLLYQFIQSFFKPDTPFTEFDLTMTLGDQFQWVFEHIKKKANVLYVLSIITHFLNEDFDRIIYEKDATSSGLQLIGLLVRSQSLCDWTNITGTLEKDIYSEFAKEYKRTLDSEETFLKASIELLSKKSLEKFINESTPLSKILLSNNEQNFEQNFNSLIKKVPREQLTMVEELKFPSILFINKIRNYKENAKQTLNLLRLLLNKYRILLYLPSELLYNRKLFKKPVMTYGYAAGNTARLQQFYDSLCDGLVAQGHGSYNKVDLEFIAATINDFFIYYSRILIFEILDYLKLVQGLIPEKAQPVRITMSGMLEWVYSIRKQEESRMNIILENGKVIKLCIYTKVKGLDRDKMTTGLPSIYVHSIDATIVSNVITTANMINKKCLIKNIPQINFFINHDCFGISSQYAFFLTPIIQHAYNRTFAYNLLDNFKSDLNKELLKSIKSRSKKQCTNPFFIKH